MTYDIIIIGSGISGATLAERYAKILNKKVLILEKRDHIAGNIYDAYNEEGVLHCRYGGHIFHTNDEGVWNYVNRFSKWRNYYHKVLSYVDGNLVPVPVNIETINVLFGTHFTSGEEVEQWLAANTEKINDPQNSEEISLSRVGKELYEKMFKNYTIKQWDIHPKDLEPSVMARIPVRKNFEPGYFSDKYQVMPAEGYTKVIERMLDHPNITVKTKSDYFKLKGELKKPEKLFFTGRIDQFFKEKIGKELQYRSLKFEFTTYDQEYYLPAATVNYPNDHDYTRIVEYKYMTGQKHPKTTVSREWSTWEGEPYYPVPTQENRDLYEKYRLEAEKVEKDGIYFVGRLANYKYFNMDQAFRNALDLFYRLENDAPKEEDILNQS